jgi:hypothetical protein
VRMSKVLQTLAHRTHSPSTLLGSARTQSHSRLEDVLMTELERGEASLVHGALSCTDTGTGREFQASSSVEIKTI